MSYNESLNPNSNYPPMSQSEWDSAPWNQEDPEEKEFNLAVSCSLSKDTSVVSCNYDGDDSLEDPVDEYKMDYYTIEDIIEFAEEAAKYMIAHEDYTMAHKFQLKRLIESCKGWTVDEFNVEQV